MAVYNMDVTSNVWNHGISSGMLILLTYNASITTW